MPKRRDTPCTKCGVLTWWHSKNSRPRNEVVCQPCRKLANVPYVIRSATFDQDAHMRKMRAALDRVLVCASCPAEFRTTAPNSRYCKTCAEARRRDHYRKKNRSRLGYHRSIRSFPLTALGDRDGWTCWLCDLPVDKALKSCHPLMASYDHVIPTSKGGSDEPDNLRLAHLRCNVARGNRETSAIVKA